MKKLVMVLICLVALSGCATTHMTKLDEAPPLISDPDQATLVIIRETFFGGGVVFWSYLDGKLIGETLGHNYFVTSVTPGPHYLVIATENTCVALFDFKAGKTYFLGQGIAMGIWRARTSGFYPMTPEDAAKAMKSCSYIAYDPKTGGEDMDPNLYQQAIDEYLVDVKENPDAFKDILEYDGVETK